MKTFIEIILPSATSTSILTFYPPFTMAGTRIERFATIFARVEGLIKSGAMKIEDKPIWFNVYKVFPPIIPPTYKREPVPNDRVPNILYPEDLVRAKFCSIYGNPKTQVITDMTDHITPTVSQRFVDKYFELKKSKMVSDEKLFETAANFLKTQGVMLKTEEEIWAEQEEKRKMARRNIHTESQPEKEEKFTLSVKDIFGEKIARASDSESDSFSSEDDER